MKGGEELDALDDLERRFLAAISQGHYRYLRRAARLSRRVSPAGVRAGDAERNTQ